MHHTAALPCHMTQAAKPRHAEHKGHSSSVHSHSTSKNSVIYMHLEQLLQCQSNSTCEQAVGRQQPMQAIKPLSPATASQVHQSSTKFCHVCEQASGRQIPGW